MQKAPNFVRLHNAKANEMIAKSQTSGLEEVLAGFLDLGRKAASTETGATRAAALAGVESIKAMTSELAKSLAVRPLRGRDLVWYINMGGGQIVPGKLARIYNDYCKGCLLDALLEFGNEKQIRPCTWEEASAYLERAKLRPVGQINLLRYMCGLFVQPEPGTPYTDGGETHLVHYPGKLIIENAEAITILPAVDCPPWMLDPVKDTEHGVGVIGYGQDYVPNMIVTYFDVGEDGLGFGAGGGRAAPEGPFNYS